eukprot:TRINITY_DN4758_c0_g1_i1.p1 TRINITY_DN4758_c0_g1~~TRINITY_DN4758_c0_g1_i1.p1  ORF type:complete len:106 (+),score=7.79 TRINITY_DN4758_c0_g1_i1:216-533(+)
MSLFQDRKTKRTNILPSNLSSISPRRFLLDDIGGGGSGKYLWGAAFLLFSVGWIYSTYHQREKLALKEQRRQERVEKREETKEQIKAQVGQLKEKYLSKKSDDSK